MLPRYMQMRLRGACEHAVWVSLSCAAAATFNMASGELTRIYVLCAKPVHALTGHNDSVS